MYFDPQLATGECQTALFLGCEHCDVCEVDLYEAQIDNNYNHIEFDLMPEQLDDNDNFTFLYGLAKLYKNLDCSSNKVPWECCCGCGLGGCKVPLY